MHFLDAIHILMTDTHDITQDERDEVACLLARTENDKVRAQNKLNTILNVTQGMEKE